MPPAPLHKTKRMKNLAVLGAIIFWIVLIFFVSIIKTKMGAPTP